VARQALKSQPIDGFTYDVMQLAAGAGLRMASELAKIVLPSIGAATGSLDLSKGLKVAFAANIDGAMLERAAAALAGNLSSPRIQEIVSELAGTTNIFGPGFGDAGAPLRVHFDDHFAARYGALVQWLWFALKVNFESFFDGLPALKTGLASASQVLPGLPSGSPST
jgi:hypothetical protein